MADVCALGELLIDFTCVASDPEGYPTMAAHPGGAPANYLAALSRLGAKTAFIGKAGNDAFGRKLKESLDRAGIDTRGLVLAEDVFTTLAFVSLDEQGDREFSFARKPGADTCLSFDEIELSLIDSCRVFHFGSLSLTDEPARSATFRAVSYARERGKLISYDPNLRLPLWKNAESAAEQILSGLRMADVVKISDDELKFLFDMDEREGAEHIIKNYGARLVFATSGERGCIAMNKKAAVRVPAMSNLHVKDTTGAGDIFGGSAMWKLLQLGAAPEELGENELREISRFACTAAGLSTEKYGGISSVPDYESIISHL